MSIIGSVQTAVSGLNAQSHAFSDLSNNIANSQTVGYKATTTSFADYVTNNSLVQDGQSMSDSVLATTRQHNDNQGTVTASTNTLALAISGNGFFNVQQASGNSTGTAPVFNGQQYYTRNGDFSQDANGYLKNTSDYYLEGYQTDSSGKMSTTLAPIQIQNVAFRPTQTTTMTVSSAIGSVGGTGQTSTTTATAYDSQGVAHDVSLTWTQTGTDTWTVSNTADPTNNTTVTFNDDGSLKQVGNTTQATGATASFAFLGTPQNMTVSLGTIGSTSGVSLSSGTSSGATTSTMTTDSTTTGTYSGIAIQSDGSVMATFDNGLSQLVAKIPLTTFSNPNGLAAQDGQAYTATATSGSPSAPTAVNTNGAGTLDVGSLESSTTDLTSNLTQLIVDQQAYGANTKVVTTANQMLQTTLAMIQ